MFDDLKRWLVMNQNFMLLIYVALIVVIVVLLYFMMFGGKSEGLEVQRVGGRLVVSASPKDTFVTSNERVLRSAIMHGHPVAQVDQSQSYFDKYVSPATYASTATNGRQGFKANIDRPGFWTSADTSLEMDREGLAAALPDDQLAKAMKGY
jgi:hypothetical protein